MRLVDKDMRHVVEKTSPVDDKVLCSKNPLIVVEPRNLLGTSKKCFGYTIRFHVRPAVENPGREFVKGPNIKRLPGHRKLSIAYGSRKPGFNNVHRRAREAQDENVLRRYLLIFKHVLEFFDERERLSRARTRIHYCTRVRWQSDDSELLFRRNRLPAGLPFVNLLARNADFLFLLWFFLIAPSFPRKLVQIEIKVEVASILLEFTFLIIRFGSLYLPILRNSARNDFQAIVKSLVESLHAKNRDFLFWQRLNNRRIIKVGLMFMGFGGFYTRSTFIE